MCKCMGIKGSVFHVSLKLQGQRQEKMYTAGALSYLWLGISKEVTRIYYINHSRMKHLQ